MSTPVLYSFRRCPYCMRAHMALKYLAIKIELREVELKNLPPQLLKISPNGTVPVLQLPDTVTMDESWDIVKWALEQNDPDNWLGTDNKYLLDAEILVETNDFSFKDDLDRYKYADRFPEYEQTHYRKACEEFIEELEALLSDNSYLLANQLTLADIAIFPFIRQFSLVDKQWFEQSSYVKTQQWLNKLINTELFQGVFQKHDLWKPDAAVIYV